MRNIERRKALEYILKGIGAASLSVILNCGDGSGYNGYDSLDGGSTGLADTIPFLFDYDSLSNVKDEIIKINGLDALSEILENYNPHDSIAQKEGKLNAIFSKFNFSEDEEIYITHVAHALWVEKNGNFNWSLKDYTEEDINNIVFRSGGRTGPDITCWDYATSSKDWYKTFPLTEKLIRDLEGKLDGALSHLDITEHVVGWVEKNFFHAYYEWGWDTYGKPREDITLEDLFRERITGCHTSALILISMLRSINIPACEVHEPDHFLGNDGTKPRHGVAYMPTLDLYVHGDYLADFAAIPPSDLLMTKDELEGWIDTERGYLEFHDDIHFKQRQYSLNLMRENDSLYIEDITLCGDLVEVYGDNLKTQLSEFNISFEPAGSCHKVISRNVEIKPLR